ncbi:MAG TPA: aminotransferase class I/II-fold pyridoxal phosphate-dependent enzyme [Gemmataceae bacterium]|nr:aminotransferase class I/II-fold pyridoxal phosphate-dependent enzyme [Gemmataceae bacterium]
MADDRPPTELGASTPLAPPLFPSSVYTMPDLDAYERIMRAEAPGFYYARDGHPNAHRLAARLAAMEGGRWGVICGSGMAAISALFLATLRSGDRVVASNRLYGRASQLLRQEMIRLGVKTDFVDLNDLEEAKKALTAPARMVYVETITNPLVRTADLPRLAQLARERGSLFVVDNTFATPVLARPLEVGADLVMESVTKMIGGHSDLTLGAVCGRGDWFAEVGRAASVWGLSSSPFDCWLAERGLETLPLRMKAASANAAALADWLAERPGVTRVIYPGRADHPDHAAARRVLNGGYGNMLCMELAGGRDAVNRFMRKATGIPFSPSLGHVSTTCSHPASTSHRFVAAEEKARQGITDGLVRLSVGCEELGRIQEQMATGLS